MFPFDFFRRRAIQSLQKELAGNPPQEPYINYGKFFYDIADESKPLVVLGPVGAYLDHDSAVSAQSILSKATENELGPKGLIMKVGFNKYINPSSFVLNYYGIQVSALTLAKKSGTNAMITLKVRELMIEANSQLWKAIYSPDPRLPMYGGVVSDLKPFNPSM